VLRWRIEDEAPSSSPSPKTVVARRSIVPTRRSTLPSGPSWSNVFVAHIWPRSTESHGMKRSPRLELQCPRSDHDACQNSVSLVLQIRQDVASFRMLRSDTLPHRDFRTKNHELLASQLPVTELRPTTPKRPCADSPGRSRRSPVVGVGATFYDFAFCFLPRLPLFPAQRCVALFLLSSCSCLLMSLASRYLCIGANDPSDWDWPCIFARGF
jgi:hypothetical protein